MFSPFVLQVEQRVNVITVITIPYWEKIVNFWQVQGGQKKENLW
jgi:hypothetical protein